MKEKKQNKGRLPGKVIAAVTFNNLASNCMWMLINYYLLFFYTDVLMIPATAATVIFTIARIWDVINDPMMGVICDRTRSKEGKSRFWLKRVAIPAGIFLALAFLCPNWATPAKIIWAGATYILLGMAQTAIGVPTEALTITITPERSERVRLGQFQAVPSMLANVLIPAVTLPFVRGFAHAGTGFFVLSMIISVMYAVSTLLLVQVTKGLDPDTSGESVSGQPSEEMLSLREMLKTAFKNKYSTLVILGNVFYMLNAGLMGSTLVYYFRYNVGNENLMGLYSTALMVGMIVCIPLMGIIARKLGNVKSVILGASVGFMSAVPRIITGDKNIVVFFICIALLGFGSGLISNMLRQCRNDAATYSQLQGVDISGALCSLFSFSQKLGQAVSSIIAAGLLAAVNYTPGETPDAATLDLFFAENLVIPMATVIVVILFLIPVIRMEKQLVKDIDEKENNKNESECI
mgnify:CR=1 FL=1